jgi:hypothetical protein
VYVDEYTEFGQFLQEAIYQNGGSANAIAHFGTCSINVDGLTPIGV